MNNELDKIIRDLDMIAATLADLGKHLATACRILEAPAGTMPQEQVTPPTPTLEDVRRMLAEKSRCGHTAEVRALLRKYGADKLSGVNPTDYAALLKEAEVIGSAS